MTVMTRAMVPFYIAEGKRDDSNQKEQSEEESDYSDVLCYGDMHG